MYISKKIRLIYTSVIIMLAQLPFIFAMNIPKKSMLASISNGFELGKIKLLNPILRSCTDTIKSITDSTNYLYDELKLKTIGLSKVAFDYTIKGYERLIASGKIINKNIVSIVDFSQPSSCKRLYVIDLEKREIIFNTFVAHGKNSGQEMATAFSNVPTSNKSSLGFYVTSHTYNGKNGYSLQLEGMEKEVNDNAMERGIVMHAADYVNEDYINSQGWIGRSQGCPAVMPCMNKPIVESIKEGSCFFIYYPDEQYLHRSALLN